MSREDSHSAKPRFGGMADRLPGTSPTQAIADWLVAEVAHRFDLDIATLDVEQPLIRYGLDSIAALELIAALEDWIGAPLSFTLMWEHPSIGAIARYVAESLVQPTDSLEDDIRAWIGDET